MIIPVLNMDATPAVQLMITISYIALVYGLSVEIIGDHPFGRELNTPYVFEEKGSWSHPAANVAAADCFTNRADAGDCRERNGLHIALALFCIHTFNFQLLSLNFTSLTIRCTNKIHEIR